jgi:hypothetical protein
VWNIHLINNVDDINKHKEIIHNAKYIKRIISGEKNNTQLSNGKVVNALTIIYIFDKPVYIKGKDKYIGRNVCKTNTLNCLKRYLWKWILMVYTFTSIIGKRYFQNPLKSIQDSEVVYANCFILCKSNLKITSSKKNAVLFLIKFMFEVK